MVEGISGKRLGQFMAERIFEPLGMTSSAFISDPGDARSASRACTSGRRTVRQTPMSDFELPQDPEIHMGGHGLYSTVQDYCRFIRMWLNDGMGPKGGC